MSNLVRKWGQKCWVIINLTISDQIEIENSNLRKQLSIFITEVVYSQIFHLFIVRLGKNILWKQTYISNNRIKTNKQTLIKKIITIQIFNYKLNPITISIDKNKNDLKHNE